MGRGVCVTSDGHRRDRMRRASLRLPLPGFGQAPNQDVLARTGGRRVAEGCKFGTVAEPLVNPMGRCSVRRDLLSIYPFAPSLNDRGVLSALRSIGDPVAGGRASGPGSGNRRQRWSPLSRIGAGIWSEFAADGDGVTPAHGLGVWSTVRIRGTSCGNTAGQVGCADGVSLGCPVCPAREKAR